VRKCECTKVGKFEGEKAERWEGAEPVIRRGRRTGDTTIARWLLNQEQWTV